MVYLRYRYLVFNEVFEYESIFFKTVSEIEIRKSSGLFYFFSTEVMFVVLYPILQTFSYYFVSVYTLFTIESCSCFCLLWCMLSCLSKSVCPVNLILSF